MNWDKLPLEIIDKILKIRKFLTCSNKCASIIQKNWKRYRIIILMGRFQLLKYLKDFRVWNPSIQQFLIRSRI